MGSTSDMVNLNFLNFGLCLVFLIEVPHAKSSVAAYGRYYWSFPKFEND